MQLSRINDLVDFRMSATDVQRLRVHLGEHNIRVNTEVKHIERKVKRLVRHKGFEMRTLYNDVALLTLDMPVTYTRTVRPICLPPLGTNDDYSGQTATVIGWGSLRESKLDESQLVFDFDGLLIAFSLRFSQTVRNRQCCRKCPSPSGRTTFAAGSTAPRRQQESFPR